MQGALDAVPVGVADLLEDAIVLDVADLPSRDPFDNRELPDVAGLLEFFRKHMNDSCAAEKTLLYPRLL